MKPSNQQQFGVKANDTCTEYTINRVASVFCVIHAPVSYGCEVMVSNVGTTIRINYHPFDLSMDQRKIHFSHAIQFRSHRATTIFASTAVVRCPKQKNYLIKLSVGCAVFSVECHRFSVSLNILYQSKLLLA